MINRALFYVLFLFLPILSHAASIKGYVRDMKTNEPLIGATVVIKGTTNGTVTDLNGYYEIPSLKQGVYTIVAGYIGYESAELDISLEAGEEVNQDFYLMSSSFDMQEVQVTIQAQGQIRAINQQLNSDYISNVVSSERLQEVPDATVADALGRIPGITVRSDNGEGNKIQIRGMEPRLNLVTVNGIRAPSADPNENSVGLAGISPFMIEEIEVQKSLTPDKDGDVVGGIVDLKLRDAEAGFKTNIVFQNNYNNLVQSAFNPRATLQLSNRFFNDKFGVVLVGNYEDIDRSSERMSAWGTVNELTTGEVVIKNISGNFWNSDFSRKRYGGSLFIDYRLPKGKIKASSFINGLQNKEFTRTFNFAPSSATPVRKNVNGKESETLSSVYSFTFQHKLFFNSSLDLGVSYTTATSELLADYNLNSKYVNPTWWDPDQLPPNIQDIFAPLANETVYPFDVLALEQYYSDSSYFIESLGSRDNVFTENEITTFINWEIPLNLTSQISGSLKMGGKYRKKFREYDANDRGHGLTVGGQEELKEYLLNTHPDIDFGIGSFTDYIGASNLSPYHLLGDFDQWILEERFQQRGYVHQSYMNQIISDLDDDNWSVTETGAHPRRNIAEDYTGSEEITAGYIMTDLNITKYLQVLGGVRVEDIKTDYRSFGIRESGVINFTLEEFGDSLAFRQNTFVLPMVNAKIKATDWLQFRFAYTQSIARPRYYSYMPRYRLDRLKFIENIGNPNLKPALSENIDAYMSMKMNSRAVGLTGIFTVGVFHKKITGYEYVKDYVNIHDSINDVHPYNVIANNRDRMISVPINNDYPAYSQGLEIDWQSAFVYLPAPFNGIVFNVNYTFTETEQTQQYQRVKTTIPNPATPWIRTLEVIDSTFKDILFSQPKHVISGSIGYDLGGFSIRVAYTGNAESLVGYFGSGRKYIENRRISLERHVFDLSLTQKVPKIEGLQLFFNMSNITGTFNTSEGVKRTNDEPFFPLYEERFGRIMILGLRYRL